MIKKNIFYVGGGVICQAILKFLMQYQPNMS